MEKDWAFALVLIGGLLTLIFAFSLGVFGPTPLPTVLLVMGIVTVVDSIYLYKAKSKAAVRGGSIVAILFSIVWMILNAQLFFFIFLGLLLLVGGIVGLHYTFRANKLPSAKGVK